jgi:hypothetical protein
MAQGLRLLNPRDPETLKGFNRFRCGLLHALKNDQALTRRDDTVMQYLELITDAEAVDLRLEINHFDDCIRLFCTSPIQTARVPGTIKHSSTISSPEEVALPRSTSSV